MSDKIYFLFCFEPFNAENDYNHFLSYLSSMPDVVAKKEDNQIIISYSNLAIRTVFKKSPAQNNIKGLTGSSFILQCDPADDRTLYFVRQFLIKTPYRIYDTSLACFLPKDYHLLAASELTVSEKFVSILQKKKYKLLFMDKTYHVFYVQPENQPTIYLLNPSLLQYFIDFGLEEKPTPELSYEIAPSLIDFISLHDQELIPHRFYDYYRKPLKIINYSGFDIDHIDRKVFIKPFFFTFDKRKQNYVLMASDKSVLSFADKIRKGETLDITLKRILREEIKIAQNYFRAKIYKIEFDRDKENILTPRLWVNIYLKEYHLSPEFKEKSQRGWSSIKDEVN